MKNVKELGSGMVVRAYNSSTQKAETGGLLQVQSQLGPQCECQASLGLKSKTLSQCLSLQSS